MSSHWNDLQRNNERTINAQRERIEELMRERDEWERLHTERVAAHTREHGERRSAEIRAEVAEARLAEAHRCAGLTPTLVPQGDPVSLAECPPGLFLFGESLGLKTEYYTESGLMMVYVADTGEAFWGGTSRGQDRAQLIVQPVALGSDASS